MEKAWRWLDEPWGAASRGKTLVLVSAAVALQTPVYDMRSDAFITHISSNFDTPFFHSALASVRPHLCFMTRPHDSAAGVFSPCAHAFAQFGCLLLVSALIFTIGGGTSTLMLTVRMGHLWQLVVIAVAWTLYILCCTAAGHTISTSNRDCVLAFQPLLMPLLCMCFEREVTGHVRLYGLWPCFYKTARQPYWGVYPVSASHPPNPDRRARARAPWHALAFVQRPPPPQTSCRCRSQ